VPRPPLVAAVVVLLAAAAWAGEAANLVANPGFEKGDQGWKTRFPEPTETKYARNHEWVGVVARPDGGGRCLRFGLNGAVAASEGVKAVTPMLPIAAGQTYEFGADVLTRGPTLKIFLEGYRAEAGRTDSGADQYPGYRRCYRSVIHVRNGVGAWATASQVAKIPDAERYRPTHVLLKLYAYWPEGEAFYDNAFVRPVGEAADGHGGQRQRD